MVANMAASSLGWYDLREKCQPCSSLVCMLLSKSIESLEAFGVIFPPDHFSGGVVMKL